MDIRFNNAAGSEVAINTDKGKYVAYGPLDQKNKDGIDIKGPDGKVEKWTPDKLFAFIIQNASPLEDSPKNDTFIKK